MALYVPPTEEKDPKKQNQSLQLIGGVTQTNTDNIATNTVDIATNTADIATNTADIATNTAAIAADVAALAALTGSKITNSLSGNVALNNTANYFDGPSVAQGSTGTWFASGSVTVVDTVGVANIDCKLWDGTTVIASARITTQSAGNQGSVSLSGYITSPSGNIRISCRDLTATSGAIVFNATGNSKDSIISAYRIA